MITPSNRCARLDLPPDPRFSAQAYLVGRGSGGPLLYWGTQTDDGIEDKIELVERHVRRLAGRASHALAVFGVADWDAAFSPWPATGTAGRHFAGLARDTLAWLKDACIPTVETALGRDGRPENPGSERFERERFLIGYSLAGLFALWSLGTGAPFAGAASCSGSLWFPGWEEYAKTVRYPEGSLAYLSLGLREERAHDPLVATVGNATRIQADRLAADPAVRASTLEWNGGGHFTEPELRIAKGVAWLLEQRAGKPF